MSTLLVGTHILRTKQNIRSFYYLRNGIILDLRNNPGGLLNQAVDLVDLFVDSGIIVSQKGREASENTEYKASAGATLTKL
ncbi:MAG: S41 family peptidase, partial [Treponema socranskii subsp. buccale]